jgi:hypothetical protein
MRVGAKKSLALVVMITFVSGHFASLLSAGVEDVRVMNHFVTSGEQLAHAKHTVMKTFSSRDSIVFFVPLQFNSGRTYLGKHAITWNWYVNNKLVSKSTKELELNHHPFELVSGRATSSLGAGQCRVEVLMDGQFLASDTFTITP